MIVNEDKNGFVYLCDINVTLLLIIFWLNKNSSSVKLLEIKQAETHKSCKWYRAILNFCRYFLKAFLTCLCQIQLSWTKSNKVSIRLFHRTTNCQGDNYTGKNFLPPIKTRSPVVKAVKLMAWRQAKSPLKITTWYGG